MYDLTVIIPTYKEEANIRDIISDVDRVFAESGLNGEILIVDDNSPDKTIAIVNEIKETKKNVRIIVRSADHGLSQSVAEGFSQAASDIFVVIDADHSHPPVLIPKMYQEILAGNDVVIGSRYREGGGIRKWPIKRRALSLGATFLGRLLFPDITDPVSGFFAVKKSVVMHAPLKPRGYKILLEVLGKGFWERDTEIPFEFSDREIGTSKLNVKTIIEYAQQVADIMVYSLFHHQSAAWNEWKRVLKFGAVGLSGILVNEEILIYLKEFAGFSLPLASVCAIELSILNNFFWNDSWTFKSTNKHRLSGRWQRLLTFHIVSAGGALINFGILIIAAFGMGVDYRIANIGGIVLAFGWNFLLNRRVTWTRT
ncbi:MAG: glycosyltransferase family 2 protein [Methanoregula sp.]|jgi:dolichol-phosphate mannosyltransferase|nr:glycosyltransferase family 2 protein [Methanoregula sp.]